MKKRMAGENVNVQMAAEAARETGADAPENPAQKLAAAFHAAIKELIGGGTHYKPEFEVQGKWVVLKIYLPGSEVRLLNKKPGKVIRGVLASYLNTPYKIKLFPDWNSRHDFEVVALLQGKQN